MLLGQLLERLGDEAIAAEALIALADLPLVAEIENAGRPFGETADVYAAGAARRFATLASDEDWLSLMTALDRADDPGLACLRQMLVWSLRVDQQRQRHGCSCGDECTGETHG
jgi:hypothetical protein